MSTRSELRRLFDPKVLYWIVWALMAGVAAALLLMSLHALNGSP